MNINDVRPFCAMGVFLFEISFLERETGAKIDAMATALSVTFCFFCDAYLWCQVSRTLLQYFHSYRLFSIFHFSVANNITSSLI